MSARPQPFNLFFEMLFLESYSEMGLKEKKAIDRAVQLLSENPRHPSPQVPKAGVRSDHHAGTTWAK